MKLFKKILALLIIPLLWGPLINAHINSYAIFKLGNKTLICLRDWHHSGLKKNHVNFKQKFDVLSWAKALNASFVVEDINDNTPGQRFSLLPLSFNDSKSNYPLCALTSWAYHSGIDVINSEFRTAWVFSALYGQGSAKIAFELLNKAVQEMKQYNDTPQLNAIYAEELQSFEKLLHDNMRFFNLFKNSEESIKQVLEKVIYNDFAQEINNIQTYYCSHEIQNGLFLSDIQKKIQPATLFLTKLLDLRLLHDLYNQKSNTIFICAGGAHINQLSQYFCNRLQGTCIGGEITCKYDIQEEPDAIDINAVLSQHFPNVKPVANSFALKLLDFKNKYPIVSALLLNDLTPRTFMAIASFLCGYGCMVSAEKIFNCLKLSPQYKVPVALSAIVIPTFGLLKIGFKFYDAQTKLIEVPRVSL